MTLHISLPIYEDIPANVDHFVSLSRQGYFIEADTFYQDFLATHARQVFIALEYARHLLRQWNCPALRTFAAETLENISLDSSEDSSGLLRALSNFPVLESTEEEARKQVDRMRHRANHTEFEVLYICVLLTAKTEAGLYLPIDDSLHILLYAFQLRSAFRYWDKLLLLQQCLRAYGEVNEQIDLLEATVEELQVNSEYIASDPARLLVLEYYILIARNWLGGCLFRWKDSSAADYYLRQTETCIKMIGAQFPAISGPRQQLDLKQLKLGFNLASRLLGQESPSPSVLVADASILCADAERIGYLALIEQMNEFSRTIARARAPLPLVIRGKPLEMAASTSPLLPSKSKGPDQLTMTTSRKDLLPASPVVIKSPSLPSREAVPEAKSKTSHFSRPESKPAPERQSTTVPTPDVQDTLEMYERFERLHNEVIDDFRLICLGNDLGQHEVVASLHIAHLQCCISRCFVRYSPDNVVSAMIILAFTLKLQAISDLLHVAEDEIQSNLQPRAVLGYVLGYVRPAVRPAVEHNAITINFNRVSKSRQTSAKSTRTRSPWILEGQKKCSRLFAGLGKLVQDMLGEFQRFGYRDISEEFRDLSASDLRLLSTYLRDEALFEDLDLIKPVDQRASQLSFQIGADSSSNVRSNKY